MSLVGECKQGCTQGRVCPNPRGLVTIYMTHLCLHPLQQLTLVFTRPSPQKRRSYNWLDSCDTSAKQQACYPSTRPPRQLVAVAIYVFAEIYQLGAGGISLTGRFSYLLGSIHAALPVNTRRTELHMLVTFSKVTLKIMWLRNGIMKVLHIKRVLNR